MLSDDAKLFRALGDETRLAIVGYLLANEHCACEFAELTEKDQTTVSRHLRVLSEAGIIKQVKRGRNVICSIRDESIRKRLMNMGIKKKASCCGPMLAVDSDSKGDRVKEVVRDHYGRIAVEGGLATPRRACCGNTMEDPVQISESLGYTSEELAEVPESNLGLGCGNPGALGAIKKGEVVLDLGSGAGIDAFLAAKRVGPEGRVIGVDFTEQMIKKARRTAKQKGFSNVEFKLGDIERLPLEDESVDVVLSNCVINLVPDKQRAFQEAYRVLRPGGRMYISDMVLLEELTEEQRNDEELIAGCVGGAILRDDYLNTVTEAGFKLNKIKDDKDISKRQYEGLPVESLKLVAKKGQGKGAKSKSGRI